MIEISLFGPGVGIRPVCSGRAAESSSGLSKGCGHRARAESLRADFYQNFEFSPKTARFF